MSCYCENLESPGRELTRHVKAGGSVCFVWQCQGCGNRIGQEVARAQLLAQGQDLQAIPDFDVQFAEGQEALRRGRAEQRRNQFFLQQQSEREEFDRRRREHMSSPKWAMLRDKVLKRDGWTCQGCLRGNATQVHHLTYSHLGEELAFQLISLCRECHEKTHHIEAAAP